MNTVLQTTLLKDRLAELGWSIRRLHRELLAVGVQVSSTNVHNWVAKGQGISDENKLRLCVLLDIPERDLLHACVAQKRHTQASDPFDAAPARLSA